MPKYYSQFDFNKITVKGFIPEASATAPSSPATGQLWTDTSGPLSILKRWDGTKWETLGEILDGSITTAKLADGAVTNDKLFGGIDNAKLATNPLSRANHTGSQAASTISDLAATVKAYSLSEFAALTGDLDLGGHKIVNLAPPTAPTDPATMAYVDASRAGFRGAKDPVRVVAPDGHDTSAPGATIDGVTLASGDRFLVPDSGIYIFNGPSTPATADNTGVSDGTTVAVAEGSDAGFIYIQRADTDGGATSDWGVFQAGGMTYTASAPLQLTGTNLSLPTLPVANGGTGATTAAAARDNLFAAGAYGETIDSGDLAGGGAPVSISHGLGTVYVGVFTTLDTTGERVELDWRVVDANTIELTSEVAVTDDLNVCVVGA